MRKFQMVELYDTELDIVGGGENQLARAEGFLASIIPPPTLPEFRVAEQVVNDVLGQQRGKTGPAL